MKSLSQFRWLRAKRSVLIVLTVSSSVLLHTNTKAEKLEDEAGLASTEAPTALDLDQSSQANLDRSTPAEVLDELVKIDSTFQRNSSLYAYLADITESDLIDLWHRTETIKRTSIRSSIQTKIVRKIASDDADQALGLITDVPRILRTPLLKALFHDWSIIKLDRAVDGAKTLIGTDRRTALATILSTREDLSSPTLLEIAQELGLEEFALRQISANQTFQMLEDPSSAWNWLVNDEVEDAMQLDLFKLVASTWREEGLDVLLRAAALFPNKHERTALSKVIEDVVSRDVEDTFDYVRNLSTEERGELPSALALAAARIDPKIALKEIAAWSDDPIYVHLQEIASTTWAQNDPRGMLDEFELVPQFTRGRALERAFTHLAYVSPMEAINNLKRANQFLSAKAILPTIIAEQWSHTDPEAALEWTESFAGSNSELRKRMMGEVFRNLIMSDIDKALEISGEVHSTELTVLPEASYDVVKKLAQMGRLDDAIARLPMLNNNAKFFAIEHLGRALVEAGDPYAAIELGANITRPDVMVTGPVIYFDNIFDLWANRDPKQLFDFLQSLTSPLLRSLAAKPLLERQKSRPVLSNESVKHAEALLSEYPLPKDLYLLELLQQDDEGLIDIDQIVLPPEMTE